MRFNERYDPGWIAFAARHALRHVRVDIAVNGWFLGPPSAKRRARAGDRVVQLIAEIVGILCVLWLLKALARGADEARIVTMTTLVPFVDLKAQFRALRAEVVPRMTQVMEDASFILGPDVARFEENFASYVGARYCVGVESGNGGAAVRVTRLWISEPATR